MMCFYEIYYDFFWRVLLPQLLQVSFFFTAHNNMEIDQTKGTVIFKMWKRKHTKNPDFLVSV